MTNYLKKLNKPVYKHLLFWIVVFLFYFTSAKASFHKTGEIVGTYFFHLLFQIIIAYTILYVVIPQYKKNKGILQAILSVAILFFLIHFMHTSVRMLFLESSYPDCFAFYFEEYGHLSFRERIFDLKNAFFHLPLFYLQPLFFLGALLSYEKQQKLSEINEQKKSIELKVLKHQLNPHFLFNTLNNLYALTLEKSDIAPDIIEKLSSILDYMLYGCDEKYVPIEKEIVLIENYLALEQIRYEDRVSIVFKNSVTKSVKIAPLLFLTFIENAFKHGVSQELDMATVNISIALNEKNIVFTIMNTKAQVEQEISSNKKRLGLANIEKQLELLYPNEHNLTIENSNKSFEVLLKLKQR